VGLDLSAPMLAVARHLAAQAGTANARFMQADAQACPLRRAAFDVVISNFGVMFFDDPGAAFVAPAFAPASVVRPYGCQAFLCWQDNTQNEVFTIAFSAHHRSRNRLPVTCSWTPGRSPNCCPDRAGGMS
jgi:SAM-dependent methyltransferase